MNENGWTSTVMVVKPDRDYFAITPRMIRGEKVMGFIKRNEREKTSQAFEFFCSEMKRGAKIELAKERTKAKFKLSVTVERCKAKTFSQEEPTIEVHIGEREAT